jgi:orotate phosphoribosyltransferase
MYAKEIMTLIYDTGLIKFWPKDNPHGWYLQSGIWSPFYIQLRRLCSKRESRELLDKIGDGMVSLIDKINSKGEDITKIIGTATAGIPIAVITTYKTGIPSCYNRKIEGVKSVQEFESIIKSYGEHSLIEGDLEDNDNVLIVDDLLTTGETKLIVKRMLEYEAKKRNINLRCNNVAVIIDREQCGVEQLKMEGLATYSIIRFKSEGIHWLKDKIPDREFQIIIDYLNDDTKYQNETYRKKLVDMLSRRVR